MWFNGEYVQLGWFNGSMFPILMFMASIKGLGLGWRLTASTPDKSHRNTSRVNSMGPQWPLLGGLMDLKL